MDLRQRFKDRLTTREACKTLYIIDESNSEAEVKQFRTSNLVSSENSLNLGNTFFAGAGDDFITGGPLNDTFKAGSGNDEVYGGEGDDQIFGGKDDDKLYGGGGDDKIFGGKDDDKLDGGGGDDKIFGSKGNDILYGCRGNDKLYGGKGADTYIISPGKDKFCRFNVTDGDVVAIDSSAPYSIKTFRNHAIIDHDEGSVLIKNISTSDLEAVIRIF